MLGARKAALGFAHRGGQKPKKRGNRFEHSLPHPANRGAELSRPNITGVDVLARGVEDHAGAAIHKRVGGITTGAGFPGQQIVNVAVGLLRGGQPAVAERKPDTAGAHQPLPGPPGLVATQRGGLEHGDQALRSDPATHLVNGGRLFAQGAEGPSPERGLAGFGEYLDDRGGDAMIRCQLVAYQTGERHHSSYRQMGTQQKSQPKIFSIGRAMTASGQTGRDPGAGPVPGVRDDSSPGRISGE